MKLSGVVFRVIDEGAVNTAALLVVLMDEDEVIHVRIGWVPFGL